jgi:putative heme-binding domain-containing protein
LLAWYDSTQTWSGGHSLTPFLETIFRETLMVYTLDERKQLLAMAEQKPLASLVLAQRLQDDKQAALLSALRALYTRLAKVKKIHRQDELHNAVLDAIAKTALAKPAPENLPDLVLGLRSANKLIRLEALGILGKTMFKPKVDNPVPFRTLLLAAPHLDTAEQKWQTVELLRRWTGRSFGADKGEWQEELHLWAQWFGQTFPKEAPLPNVEAGKPVVSKYKYEELLAFLTREPAGQKGDIANGRKVFTKALCIKCHKYGKEGEGIGPDLSTVSKRFKRTDILESIYYPSKVISDQYRSVTITTAKGLQITGLAGPQGNKVTVLQGDGTKVDIDKKDIESQIASLVSVMPEKLLDTLTKKEIADLFAFLESEPAK